MKCLSEGQHVTVVELPFSEQELLEDERRAATRAWRARHRTPEDEKLLSGRTVKLQVAIRVSDLARLDQAAENESKKTGYRVTAHDLIRRAIAGIYGG